MVNNNIRVISLIFLLGLMFALSSGIISAGNASVDFCVNMPPEITDIRYSLNTTRYNSEPDSLNEVFLNNVSFVESENLTVYLYSEDPDENDVYFVLDVDYVWNNSPQPSFTLQEVAPGISKLAINGIRSANFLDNRYTFQAYFTVIMFDDSGCALNSDNITRYIELLPFSKPTEFVDYNITPEDNRTNVSTILMNDTSHNSTNSSYTYNWDEMFVMYESQNITLTAKYYDPDNNNSQWQQYPDLDFPILNNTLDNEAFKIFWYEDGKLKKTKIDKNYSDIGTTSYTFRTNYKSAGKHTLKLEIKLNQTKVKTVIDWTIKVKNVNRPPNFTRDIDDYEWYQGSPLRAFNLFDYVNDSDVLIGDGDYLSFSTNYLGLRNISVTISPYEPYTVDFDPESGFIGKQRVSFNVTDKWGATDTSNNITLNVKQLIAASGNGTGNDQKESHDDSSTQSSSSSNPPPCYEQWYCTKWVCKPENRMYRTCYDMNSCGSQLNKPNTTQKCEYIPECFDEIKNQGEEGIDCGGPCPPCYSCFDRMKNQGETGVDCGGPCKLKCENCSDNLRNQGEEGIDCGGPCDACPSCEDGVKNQKEEDIDCGGPCVPCKTYIPTQLNEIFSLPKSGAVLNIILLLFGLVVFGVFIYFFIKFLPNLIESLKKVEMPIKSEPLEKKIPISYDEKNNDKVLDKFNEMEKDSSKQNKEGIEEIADYTKKHFTKLLNISPAITSDELETELKRKGVNDVFTEILVSFFKKVNELEYSQKELTKKEYESMILEAKEIVKLTIPEEVNEKKKVKKKKSKKIKISKIDKEEVFNLISNSYKNLLKGDVHGSGEYYHKALEIYEQLEYSDKTELYDSLDRLRHEIDLFENKFS